jgi:hypothetical protein
MIDNNIENMISNIENIKKTVNKLKDIISKIYVYGESGAGLVKVKIDGNKKLVKLSIDQSLIKEEKFVIEDLITNAINNGNKKAYIEINKKTKTIMEEIGIPKNFISILPILNSK